MTPEPGPMVEAKKLVKHFPGVFAVKELSFSVGKGEIFGLAGPDGAGKTTVIRLLAGVMPPDSGTATIDGIDVVLDPEKAKQHLSYMPQRFGLYEDLTVDENVRFYADIFELPVALRNQRIGPLLTSFGMEPFRKRLAGQLSGGMKQKLGLVCALIHTPKILLLDEPTTGVALSPAGTSGRFSTASGRRESRSSSRPPTSRRRSAVPGWPSSTRDSWPIATPPPISRPKCRESFSISPPPRPGRFRRGSSPWRASREPF